MYARDTEYVKKSTTIGKKLTCELMMTYGEEGSMTSLLDVESIHIDSSSNCVPGSCSETEVCVDMRDGSSTCLDLDLCPTTDWKHFNHKCYLFSGTYTTEQQNVVFCNSLNATLVRVDNAEVNSFLVSEITTRGIPDMWLAANDKVVEGEWVWGPGDDVLTTMWGPGEPNPHDNSEDCAGLRRVTGLWADYSCTKNVHVVCEVPYGLFP
ncbi:perlucin-like [Pecten maximus]|uniref:perlucin-like n=1 Tax=Pecten maximus TaxID=6579 RepID=UPI001458617B|nr:perlucin-like [Pecten maximus]